jgi:hypothetical protein
MQRIEDKQFDLKPSRVIFEESHRYLVEEALSTCNDWSVRFAALNKLLALRPLLDSDVAKVFAIANRVKVAILVVETQGFEHQAEKLRIHLDTTIRAASTITCGSWGAELKRYLPPPCRSRNTVHPKSVWYLPCQTFRMPSFDESTVLSYQDVFQKKANKMKTKRKEQMKTKRKKQKKTNKKRKKKKKKNRS